jgi:hypothetical protein
LWVEELLHISKEYIFTVVLNRADMGASTVEFCLLDGSPLASSERTFTFKPKQSPAPFFEPIKSPVSANPKSRNKIIKKIAESVILRDKKVYGDNKVKTTANYCPATPNCLAYNGSRLHCQLGESNRWVAFSCGANTSIYFDKTCQPGSPGMTVACTDQGLSSIPSMNYTCSSSEVQNVCPTTQRTKVVYEDTYQLP